MEIILNRYQNAFVKSREERKAVDGDKLEQNDTAATAATAESDRYPLKGGFEAVFWKQTPSRRRSIDNLMPTPYLQTMRLGVSPPDVAAMGFLRTKDTATKRRHSHSGSPLEQVSNAVFSGQGNANSALSSKCTTIVYLKLVHPMTVHLKPHLRTPTHPGPSSLLY